ncbi:4045_t:CDS:2, partial [Diversispora eburnea]
MAIASFESQEGKDQVINFEWIAGEYRVKIVDTILKMCHRCHAEDHLVISCPVVKKQRKISERKARDFEKYVNLARYKRNQGTEKSKAQITNDKKEEKEMEKTINYIYEIVKALLEENKTTLAQLNG